MNIPRANILIFIEKRSMVNLIITWIPLYIYNLYIKANYLQQILTTYYISNTILTQHSFVDGKKHLLIFLL
jgi:hypothetical protein